MNRTFFVFAFFAASCATAPKPVSQEQSASSEGQTTDAVALPYTPARPPAEPKYDETIHGPWTGYMVVDRVLHEVAIVPSDDADPTTHEIPGGTKLQCRRGMWKSEWAKETMVVCDVPSPQDLFLKRVTFPTGQDAARYGLVLVELDALHMLEGGLDCMLFLNPGPATVTGYHAAGVFGEIYKTSLQEIAFCIGRDCDRCVRAKPAKAQ